ncbi:PAS domain-containing hybrid sensor histidine kinase/response regulator [Christiangramia echinicola]|uniref:histidine kinase n=1 Tax=Christiangramia echinicola TaxID=279359 RepID=A0A1H1KRW5_9FLAO|nr:PAS domain S-box protein [Christiangramia echinicola]SDR65024.1 PAS/PAC sensor hybrid histidine kinase [Christiangramia echinicola]
MPLTFSFDKMFARLATQDASLVTWITEDILHGIWILKLSETGDIWINTTFWKSIGFKNLSESEQTEKWNSIIPDELKTGIEKIQNNALIEEVLGEECFEINNQEGQSVFFYVKSRKIKLSSSEEYVVLKFSENVDDQQNLSSEQKKFQDLNAIYQETNELAKVGGWEVDLVKNKLFWTKVTYDIHEVNEDYEPRLEEGINFYKEGDSREKIIRLFGEAVENGIPFDSEFKLITAKNKEIWVRSFGKPEFKDGKCVRVYGAFQDINAKKLSELNYERAKERFEIVFNHSSIGNILVNIPGKILLLNPAAIKIFGYQEKDRELAMTLTFRDLIHPDFLEVAIEYRNKLINNEINKYHIEAQFYKKDGTLIWCRLHSAILRFPQKGEDLIISQVEDITSRKELEFEAKENAKRFKSAFEYSPNGMGVVSLDGTWLMVNQNLSSMFGYSKEEFMTKTFRELTHLEDLKKDTPQLQSLLNFEIDTYSVEKRFIHKSGKTIFGLLNVSAIVDDNGKALYLIGQISDITKRILSQRALQKSLKELQSLMDATTQVSLIQTDMKGIVQKFNKGAENLLGYSAEEVIKKMNVKSIHDDEEVRLRGEELSEQFNKEIKGFDVFTAKAKKGNFDAREWTYIRKDGSKFIVQLVVTAIRNHKENITGYLGVATDISQLKDMESSLRIAKKKAETANKAKSEFLANMSHEIRTPLNGIIGFTDLLMRTQLDESQSQYMKTVYNSANSLMDLINDVLDFSKIEAGKLELSEERTDLVVLCAQTVDIVKHQAHKKGLEVLLNISPYLRRYVYADTVRIRQILTNLLGNAVKFTSEGEIELSVDSQVVEEHEEELLFSFAIRDTGIGIANNNLKKIFNAFDQEDASTTRKYGGSGLGLTISNKLLNLMNSKLEVQSRLNEGSVFSFKVKLKTEKEIIQDAKPFCSIKNVLIVDDNANNRIILREMLTVNKIKSSECSNGIEALGLLKEKKEAFDLAIIDYNMPYMDGINLIKQIRTTIGLEADKLPIILLHSSINDDVIINGCKKFDVQFNITKPINLHKLYEIIEEIEQPYIPKVKSEEDISGANNFLKDYNILIAEDNPVNKFLANTIIKKALPNANLFQAENGEEAIEQFKNQELDLIFMDIQMPILSGFEATQEIRKLEKENSHIPIIALTARTVKDEMEKYLELGMDDYLSKPVVLEDIKEKIIQYLISK